jgi:hypothetical protein
MGKATALFYSPFDGPKRVCYRLVSNIQRPVSQGLIQEGRGSAMGVGQTLRPIEVYASLVRRFEQDAVGFAKQYPLLASISPSESQAAD